MAIFCQVSLFYRVFFSSLPSDLFQHSAKILVCRVLLFCLVWFLMHSANNFFTECPIECTQQSFWHSTNPLFSVVLFDKESTCMRTNLSCPLHIYKHYCRNAFYGRLVTLYRGGLANRPYPTVSINHAFVGAARVTSRPYKFICRDDSYYQPPLQIDL